MIPDMSSDRVNAYRVFQGEIEKLRFMKKFPPDNSNPDHLTGIEALVINYLEQRCAEMVKKGYGWDDDAPSTRDDFPQYEETEEPQEDYEDSGRRT